MKTIIAGSRDIPTKKAIGLVRQAAREACDQKRIFPSVIVCGCAEGVDEAGCQYARMFNLPVEFFPAWEFQQRFAVVNFKPEETIHEIDFGGAPSKARGAIRNREMAKYADALIAVWDGKSRGTKNMIEEATKRGLKVYVYRTN